MERLNSSPEFPAELVGKRILLATESLGPVNGVSRTTQSLVDYLRSNGVNVATCAPYYKGQPIDFVEGRPGRSPIISQEWVRSIEAKSSALTSRAIGGAWLWHFARDETPHSQPIKTPLLTRNRSHQVKRETELGRSSLKTPDFRLQGISLPYNPDLTVAFPFRLGVVYKKTFKPDIVYLASPASGWSRMLQSWEESSYLVLVLTYNQWGFNF